MVDCQIAVLRGDISDIILKKKDLSVELHAVFHVLIQTSFSLNGIARIQHRARANDDFLRLVMTY